MVNFIDICQFYYLVEYKALTEIDDDDGYVCNILYRKQDDGTYENIGLIFHLELDNFLQVSQDNNE